MSIKGMGAGQMRNPRKEWEFQVQFDKLLEEVGDAPRQREMRQLEERLKNGEGLTERQSWQLRNWLTAQMSDAEGRSDRLGIGGEQWGRDSEELDIIEKKLGFGLE